MRSSDLMPSAFCETIRTKFFFKGIRVDKVNTAVRDTSALGVS